MGKLSYCSFPAVRFIKIPFQDDLVLLRITCAEVRQGLRNIARANPGVEEWSSPAIEIKFKFDSRKRDGARVLEVLLEAGGKYKPLEEERKYRTVVKGLMACGTNG